MVPGQAVLLSLLLLATACCSVASNNDTAASSSSQQQRQAAEVGEVTATVEQPLQPQTVHPSTAARPAKVKVVHVISPTAAAKPRAASKRQAAADTKAAAKLQGAAGVLGSRTANDDWVEDTVYDIYDEAKESELVLEYCPAWRPGTSNQGITAADRPEPMLNVFSELTMDEYKAVLTYLFSLRHFELDDISRDDDAAASTVLNYVHAIHMEPPPKSDVVAHLDQEGAIPPRKARATLVMGKAQPPSVHEVLVTINYASGRPTASNLLHTNILSSTWNSLPYCQRPQGILDENGAHVAVESVRTELNQFLGWAFKGWSYGEDCAGSYKCIDWTLTYAQHFGDHMPRGAYLQFYWNDSPTNDGNYIHPIPLQMLVAARGKDLAEWYVSKVWFNGLWFNSVKELKQAWAKDKDGIKSNWDFTIPGDESGLYSTYDVRHGKQRGEDQPVGPLVWEPFGRRFTITGGNRISWLGWSLYVGYLPHHGPRYWDMRFKGERVAYELSMQEAMSMYGGNDLAQANGIFLDSAFGLGYNYRQLNQGIDCPMNAAFMDVSVFYGGMAHPKSFKNAICVFERHTDVPLMRHYSSTFKFFGAVPNSQLVVRVVSSIYNVDYIQDLLLEVDGTINVKVYTSGYSQTGPALPNHPKHFGYPLAHGVASALHTQVLAWKVDLDIAGSDNSVKMHHLKLTEADDGAGGKVWVNKYDTKICKTEEESALAKGQAHHPVVINEDETNMWGSPRGYKVVVHGGVPNMLPDNYARKKGLGFWKWGFVATRQKDDETHSSSCYTQSDLTKPPVDVCAYVDGDNIRRKDIVLWLNSGRTHIPTAEDAPSLATSSGGLGFTLSPFNWGDENAATDVASMIQIDDRSEDTGHIVTDVLYKCAPTYTTLPFFKDGEGGSYGDSGSGSGSDGSEQDGGAGGGGADSDEDAYNGGGDNSDEDEGSSYKGRGGRLPPLPDHDYVDSHTLPPLPPSSYSTDGEYDATYQRVHSRARFQKQKMVTMLAGGGATKHGAAAALKTADGDLQAKPPSPPAKPSAPAATHSKQKGEEGEPAAGQQQQPAQRKARPKRCGRASRFNARGDADC